jgi:hypothetical protein
MYLYNIILIKIHDLMECAVLVFFPYFENHKAYEITLLSVCPSVWVSLLFLLRGL